ncbi:MAG: hypothetical protein AAGA99_25760 [Actinomycetota bacterium]
MSDQDDEQLLDDLRRVVGRADPTPNDVVAAAKAAIELRDLDAELAELVADELADAGTRSAVSVEPLVFEVGDVVIEVLVEEARLEVVVAAPTVTSVVVRAPTSEMTLDVDSVGRAVADLPAGRPLRVEAQLGGRRVVTEWFVP